MGRKTLVQNTKEMQANKVPINQDKERLDQINTIMKRIAAVSHLPELPYNMTLYQTDIVNAAAAPGGSMFVFEGLYDPEKGMVKDEDELAAVIAHEIAHVNCRHVTERLTRVMPVVMATEIGAQILIANDSKDWANILRLVSAGGMALWIPSYSRKDEAEADRVGMVYMARAGYDPRAAPRIWKRVADEKGDKSPASIFATHPSGWDRYQALNNMLPSAMEEYRKATGSYPTGYSPGTSAPTGQLNEGNVGTLPPRRENAPAKTEPEKGTYIQFQE